MATMATIKIATQSTVGNAANHHRLSPRFIIYVAGGVRPILSFESYFRAEKLAIFFAGLTRVRMEVFDSKKEICYFVEPSEAKRPIKHNTATA